MGVSRIDWNVVLLVVCVACVAEVVATLCEWLYQLRAGVFVECGACWTVVGCGLVLPVWQRKTICIPRSSSAVNIM